MLLHMKRGLTAALILTLTLTLGVPALAADPLAGGGFAQVAISAKNSDSPTLDLDLALYRRNSSNAFTKVESMDYVTPVNRLTKDMTFILTPQAKQVTLTVDYLTDLNGDGVYELLSGQDRPVGDVLSADGTLTSASSGVSTQLTQGRTYSITGNALLARGQAAIQDRTTAKRKDKITALFPCKGSAFHNHLFPRILHNFTKHCICNAGLCELLGYAVKGTVDLRRVSIGE